MDKKQVESLITSGKWEMPALVVGLFLLEQRTAGSRSDGLLALKSGTHPAILFN